jgi:hypothetical protein
VILLIIDLYMILLALIGALKNEPSMEFVVSRESVVGIATSYGLDGRGIGVRVPVGSRIFSSPNRPDRL